MAAIVKAAHEEAWSKQWGVKVAAVISNKPHASGLTWLQERAEFANIKTEVIDHSLFESREAFDQLLMAQIDAHNPELVVLAGFMRILTPAFVAHYQGRLMNIHPSLLPAFAGLNTHQRAIDAGSKFAGATVHQVSVDVDQGQILAQAVVPVLECDTAETLAARVLTQEHLIFPSAVAAFFRSQAVPRPTK